MALPPDPSAPDPLLEPTRPSSRFVAPPTRTPIGNSILTLVLVVVLLGLGLLVWWASRPAAIDARVGARTWAIVEVDGAPLATADGRVSVFVLDGTGQVRATGPCETSTGTWSAPTAPDRLVIEWDEPVGVACTGEPPAVAAPITGDVDLEGAEMSIADDERSRRAVSLDDLPVASAEELAGTWLVGGSVVELGARGLIRIDECSGSWTASAPGIVVQFDDDVVGRGECPLAATWSGPVPIVPLRHDDLLLVRRDLPVFPVDRQVHRLDRASGAPAP